MKKWTVKQPFSSTAPIETKEFDLKYVQNLTLSQEIRL